MSTHIGAKQGDIAKGILLPGDPRRAKYIADNFLQDPVQFNSVRGMLGYTGSYEGKQISVMGTGMGIPSIAIYITELMREYGVETLIRVGTCGSFKPDIRIRDIILAQGACTTSDINRNIFSGTYCPVADFDLLRTAHKTAGDMGLKTWVGNVLSADLFYDGDMPMGNDMWIKYGVLGVEMEAAALFTLAKKYGRRALALLTVSDSIVTDEQEMTPQQREQSLNNMIEIALKTAGAFS